jgi:hypothetical protein
LIAVNLVDGELLPKWFRAGMPATVQSVTEAPANEEVKVMTVRLNNRAYEHAKTLINEGKFV